MNKLYTIQEIASKLGLADKTLRRWEDAGKFTPPRTLGNQRRYSVEDLQILDAIKHGLIAQQSDLLTPEQAAELCGVSPTTITRWDDEGRIYPFVTSDHIYYLKSKLQEQLSALKISSPDPEPILEPVQTPANQPVQAKPVLPPLGGQSQPPAAERTVLPVGSDLEGSAQPRRHIGGEGQTLMDKYHSNLTWSSLITNIMTTLILILAYHFFFASRDQLISPQPQTPVQTGSVQGATAPDPRLDILEKKLLDHLADELLKDSQSKQTATIQLDNAALISGTATLLKDQSQISITHELITRETPVTVTFTSDFAPAKKYWVTTTTGSFTLHTDFPVGTNVSFNYNFIVDTKTGGLKPNLQ